MKHNEVVEEGLKHIIPARKNEWIRTCSRLDQSEVEKILKIMILIDEGKLSPDEITDKVEEDFAGKYNDLYWSWLEEQVVTYHPRGYDWATNYTSIRSTSRKNHLHDIYLENTKLFNTSKR